MIRRQDALVLFLYYLGYSTIRNSILRLQRRPVTRFITFHDIPSSALKFFEDNLNFLKRNTNVVSLDDFFLDKLSSDRINVVITFDDGYKSWVTHGIPILRDLGLPASFFISSGFVGLSKHDESEFIRSKLFSEFENYHEVSGGLSFDDVRQIIDEGFIIGGHTLNHCNLSKQRSRAQVEYEIREDKKRLEMISGKKVKYFAYPSGEYQNAGIDLTKILIELGYSGAVTIIPGFNSVRNDPYQLHRDLTRAWMTRRVFRARVFGNYDAVQFVKRCIRP